MSEPAIWLTLFGMGLITFSQRFFFILFHNQLAVPPLVRRGLQYVPPAVLSAVIAPELFMPAGTIDLSLQNFRLIAGLFSILVAWRTRNVFLTIGSGMALLWLLQTVFG
jgi:branched-subunit amino acid transport protein